jgi:hypothetical protein
MIGPDGTYSVPVPTGEAKVIVSCVDEDRLNRITTQAANHGRGAPLPANVKVSLIPQRYTDWDASGLMVRVERGQTVRDFDLTR